MIYSAKAIQETYRGGGLRMTPLDQTCTNRAIRKFWRHSGHLRLIPLTVIAFLYLLLKLHESKVSPNEHGFSVLGWDKLPSSTAEEVQWMPCYTDFHCARLIVPLDYAVPNGGHASIAMVKLASSLKSDDGRHPDPILFNPGGPGTSGVNFLLTNGARIRKIVGEEFDLIGFDPRGVARSTPRIIVFPDEAEGATWNVQAQSAPLPNMTADAVARIRARSLVYNALAESRINESAQHVGTAAVARDMMSIVKAHGRERLYFWGFSYGTIIGETFAAMFPNHIGRMVIDGVVDANNYYSGLWSNNLRTFDVGLRLFFEACVEAGPRSCALHEKTADEVRARLESIFDTLKRYTLAVPPTDSDDRGEIEYGVVDYALARRAVFMFMFHPYPGVGKNHFTASELASALAAIEQGKGRPLWNLEKQGQQRFVCDCSDNPRSSLSTPDDPSALAIACGEGEPVADNVEELEQHYKLMAQDSSFADVWPNRRARCTGWKIRAKERYAGPFVANTSNPILLIGNIGDPATPLSNAHTIASGFNGSVVLTQASAGHSSMAALSSCTTNAVREYFRSGILPPVGTVCGIQSGMFDEI